MNAVVGMCTELARKTFYHLLEYVRANYIYLRPRCPGEDYLRQEIMYLSETSELHDEFMTLLDK